VLFLLVTGEEKGLQGSRYFTRRPTVPVKQMAANLNLDMFLPLFPLKSLIYFGGDESTLGDAARDVGGEFRIAAAPDPMPDQVIFIRSDQYNFVLQGVPSLMFLFGYDKGSPEEKIQQEWFQNRYHAVSDDATQPVDKQGAEKFLDYLTALTKRVANDKTKPAWKSDSYFRRFAR
jgi:Zn-dependent M28 family amino/carboxypeptidase